MSGKQGVTHELAAFGAGSELSKWTWTFRPCEDPKDRGDTLKHCCLSAVQGQSFQHTQKREQDWTTNALEAADQKRMDRRASSKVRVPAGSGHPGLRSPGSYPQQAATRPCLSQSI